MLWDHRGEWRVEKTGFGYLLYDPAGYPVALTATEEDARAKAIELCDYYDTFEQGVLEARPKSLEDLKEEELAEDALEGLYEDPNPWPEE